MSVITLALLMVLQGAPPAMPSAQSVPVAEQLDPRQKSYAVISAINDACERSLKAVRVGQAQAAQVQIDDIVEKLFWLRDNAPFPREQKARNASQKELTALQKEIAKIDTLIARDSKRTNDRMTQFQYRLARFAKTLAN
jgi:inorganic triphosphatase YgiF